MINKTTNNVIIYTPESSLRHPSHLLRDMFKDLFAGRELAWRLTVRGYQRTISTGRPWSTLGVYTAPCPYPHMDIFEQFGNRQGSARQTCPILLM